MRTVLLVDMKHMDAQTIPLVKRAVTYAAWKLPVSCINAARVFQVTVSVVFIGKHFTTPLTLVLS